VLREIKIEEKGKIKEWGDKMIFAFNLNNLFTAIAGLNIEFCFNF
jgi:hypothetical protein